MCACFAKQETFGYSVQEAVANGLCPLVKENENTCYAENIIPELRFYDLDDLYIKIDYLTNNKDEKEKLILKQQELSSQYKQDKWVNKLLEQL